MIKIVDLSWQVIKKPSEAFKRIKEEKSTTEAVIIFLIYALTTYLTFQLLITRNPELKSIMASQAKILSNPILHIISTIIWILIFTGILFFFIKRKDRSLRFLNILELCLFTFTPIILLFPLQIISLSLNLIFLSPILTWAQLIWPLVLLIIGIKVFLAIQTKDALIISIKSSLIFVLLMAISVAASAKLIGSSAYLTK